MKKIPTIFAIIALLVVNITSVMHAHAASVGGEDVSIVVSLDTPDGGDSSVSNVDCAQCTCHAGAHVVLHNTAEYVFSQSSDGFISSDLSYLSQLHSPPFQPPQV